MARIGSSNAVVMAPPSDTVVLAIPAYEARDADLDRRVRLESDVGDQVVDIRRGGGHIPPPPPGRLWWMWGRPPRPGPRLEGSMGAPASIALVKTNSAMSGRPQ